MKGEINMTYNRPNPDDRSDNVEKLQDAVQNTIENIEATEDTLEFTPEGERESIIEKNHRREESIEAMRSEIKDESKDRKNGYSEGKI
jgi:small acid-soluble spore protein (thioredoxin-like protein)